MQQQAERGALALIDGADLRRGGLVGGEHVPVGGDHLLDADFLGQAEGFALDLRVRSRDGAHAQGWAECAPALFGAAQTVVGKAPAGEDGEHRLRREELGLRRGGGELGDGVRVAVVDVRVGEQHPVGIGDALRREGDWDQALEVGRVEFFDRIGEVGVEIERGAGELELAAGLTEHPQRDAQAGAFCSQGEIGTGCRMGHGRKSSRLRPCRKPAT
ncbi:hypothetical protein Thiowin_00164 [Thiorhodovibrio winogradskyi]|uniref:Uncharacterized protein n=1 Tax=Thiorhodovibrio winogradskyi TaxID=77007 RepID=A0ABZ0S423_9GAMM|nr:hypothetical protein [Thiorhodovibrio winogradskyi]